MKQVLHKELQHAYTSIARLQERVESLEIRKSKEGEINSRIIKNLNSSVKTSSDRINIIDVKLASYAYNLEKLHNKVK